MNYSNGFDLDVVLPTLQQRLGWQQPTQSGSPVLDANNLASTSGRYFGDDFHALCTIENIKASQGDPNISDANFNTYLYNKQTGMIMRALNETFRKPEIIEQQLLYTRLGFSDILVPNNNQYVGWCIETANDPAYSTQITFATLYFNQDVTFNMYLFQDGVRTPLKTISVTAQAFQHTMVEFDQMVLSAKTGIRYYLVYNQNDLGSAQAIREQVETYAQFKIANVYSIGLPVTTDGSYFNQNNRQYPAQPLGINLEVMTFKDHTQQILRKANFFDEVQGLQMAAFAMELTNNSNRSNKDQRQSEQQSQQQFIELNQAFATKEVPVTPGLKSRIMAEFKRLRETFFPPATPISMDMSECGVSGYDAYEQTWAQANWNAMNNPGVFVQ
jgi:hypothetical protein